MLVVDLLFVLVALALALGVLVVGGLALTTILLDERPETLLSDPAARRSLLGG